VILGFVLFYLFMLIGPDFAKLPPEPPQRPPTGEAMEDQRRTPNRRLPAVTFKRAIKIDRNWSSLSLEQPF